MSDDKLTDPRAEAVARKLRSRGFYVRDQDWESLSPAIHDLWIEYATRILCDIDSSDAEHGIVRVHQSSIDNDASRIAAAQRAGGEIREALRLPATANWAEVLAAASGVPRYER